ncbi:MAG: hypothetical protein AB7E47_05920 [Desulfovibrionaceae bacterium]
MGNLMLVCSTILCMGAFAGLALGKGWPVNVAVGIALLLWTVGVFALGMVAAYKTLDHGRYRYVEDGEERMSIVLYLGPLSYRVDIPEATKNKGVNHEKD